MKLGSIQGRCPGNGESSSQGSVRTNYGKLDMYLRKESIKRRKGFTYSKKSFGAFLSRALRLI